MKVEDLLKLTLEEALAMPQGHHHRSVIARWTGAQSLVELEKAHNETQNPAIILEAIYHCTLNDFAIPEWCALAYLNAYRKVTHFKAKSWDDVFGRPHPKGTHLDARREELVQGHEVYRRINEIKAAEPETPIDEYLFERVGRELAIGGKTKVAKIYYTFKEKFFPESS